MISQPAARIATIATAAMAIAARGRGFDAPGQRRHPATHRGPLAPRPPGASTETEPPTQAAIPTAGAIATTSNGAAIDEEAHGTEGRERPSSGGQQKEGIARPAGSQTATSRSPASKRTERPQLPRPEVWRPPLDDRRREGTRDRRDRTGRRGARPVRVDERGPDPGQASQHERPERIAAAMSPNGRRPASATSAMTTHTPSARTALP